MDRIAVSGTVDAGSIPAWSAKIQRPLQHTDKSSAGKQRQPAELVAKVFLLGEAGKQRPPAELISEGLLSGVDLVSSASLRN